MSAFAQYDLIALIAHWLYPFLRIGGVLLTAPIIGTRVVPVRVRLVLCLAISLAIVPVLPVTEIAQGFGFQTLIIGVQQLIYWHVNRPGIALDVCRC